MSTAMTSGVTGLKAHQTMIDVAGNNLSNISTYGFKTSRVMFSDLLSQTLKEATAPIQGVGGTNPMQMGSGVAVSSIDRNITQGNLESTGRALDLAMEGNGLFVLNDGSGEVYTRVGAFAVDATNFLVDPAMGYRMQRIGTMGEADGFQTASSRDIHVPYDTALTGKATAEIAFNGNLSADLTAQTTTTMRGGVAYTSGSGTAVGSTLLASLNEASGLANGDIIRIYGTDKSDNAVDVNYTINTATSTADGLLAAVTTAFGGGSGGSSAYLSNGEIFIKDDTGGFSRLDMNLSYSGAGAFQLGDYFNYLAVGGEATKTSTVEMFDGQGVSRVAAFTFTRQTNVNQWDLVVNSITGGGAVTTRRVEDIQFDTDGSFLGLGGTGQPQIEFNFPGTGVQTIEVNLGTVGQFDGVTQFGGTSTAAAYEQDGYEAGGLMNLSVSQEGTLVGVFSNGIIKDIASLNIAMFQNPAALRAIGGNYFIASPNSGMPVATRAMSGGAGAVRGGALEGSNVDMAEEFVTLIEAQRGFQANARTITVSDAMLRELSNLIR